MKRLIERPRLMLCIGAVFSGAVFAQCNPEWLAEPGQGIPGVSNPVLAATTWDPDGPGPLSERLVIGGDFTYAGTQPAGRVAAFDGVSWDSLGGGVGAGSGGWSSVYALTTYKNELVVGGGFGIAGTVSSFGLAAWNGQSWRSLGGQPGQQVRALIATGDVLIAGGVVLTGGNPSGTLVARWDGQTWEDITWGIDLTSVYTFAEHQGEIVAGGWVNNGGTTSTVSRLVGSKWEPIGQKIGGWVSSAHSHDGRLYVGGQFLSAGGVTAKFIARWDSEQWNPVGAGMTNGNSWPAGVWSMATYQGKLFAGGRFIESGGLTLSNIARWTGEAWVGLGPALGPNGEVMGMTLWNDRLIAVGTLTAAGGMNALRAASWDGDSWAALGTEPTGPVSGPDAPVAAIAKEGDDLYLGGTFTTVGGLPARRVVRRDSDGWHTLGSGVNGSVRAIAIGADGVYVGGTFSEAGGEPANNVARWDGTTWHALGSGLTGPPGLFGVAETFLVLPDQRLLVGGNFTTAGQAPAGRLAVWDGAIWSEFGDKGGANGNVTDLLQTDAGIVAAGIFSVVGGVESNMAARWTGRSWEAMPGLPYPGGPVCGKYLCRLGQHQGTLYLALGLICAQSGTETALFEWTGSQWKNATALGGVSYGWIQDFADDHGDLLVAGSFKSIGGVALNGIGRWNGTAWSPLGTGFSTVGSSVGGAAALLVDGPTIHAVGGFWNAGGHPSAYWSRWACACPPDCDASGGLNLDDFICFQTLLALGDPAADCDASGGLNIDDFICFQTLFALGC